MIAFPKILIVGAGGFIGQNLVGHLSGKHHVYSMRREQLNLLNTEAIKSFFESTTVDVILHCAATGGSRLTNYDNGDSNVLEQNLRIFFNVARCIKSQQRLIYFGSGAEYDRPNYRPKMMEDFFDENVPEDAYGFAKYVISQYISKRNNLLDLRIFGLYGPGEDYRYKFISNAIIKSLMGLPITIVQNVVFDYLYISDFVRLIDKLLDIEWPHRHMNITPTESIDLVSIARIVNKITGNDAGIKVLNPGMNNEYTGDNRRLIDLAGSFSFTTYEQGIRELTDYYQSIWGSLDLDTIRVDPYIDKCIIRT